MDDSGDEDFKCLSFSCEIFASYSIMAVLNEEEIPRLCGIRTCSKKKALELLYDEPMFKVRYDYV